MSKFRYSRVGAILELYVEDYTAVEPPAEVPRAAWRDGEYYVRTGKGQHAEYYCYDGKWYDGKTYNNDPRYSSLIWWCVSEHSPDRCLTAHEVEAISYLLRTRLLPENSALVLRYYAWEFYLQLRATILETKRGNLRAKKFVGRRRKR